MGLAGRRPGSEQSHPAPPTWGEGGGRRLAATRTASNRRRPCPGGPSRSGPAGGPLLALERRPFGTMGPPPPPPSRNIQRLRSAARHGARRPESEGRRMAAGAAATGRSASLSKRCPQTPRGSRGVSADRSPATPGRARRGLHTKRGPPSLRQGRGPPARLAADGPRRPPSPRPSGANGRAREGPSLGLTHSSVPQLMAELEDSHRLAEPPSVRPSVGPAVGLCGLRWLVGRLAALVLWLRRCRHRRVPQ